MNNKKKKLIEHNTEVLRPGMAVTSADVTAFIEAKGRELRKVAPGFSCLDVGVNMHDDGTAHASFKAYNEHVHSSPHFADVDDAIAWIEKRAKGRKESEMIIAEATKLLKKAEELASNGK